MMLKTIAWGVVLLSASTAFCMESEKSAQEERSIVLRRLKIPSFFENAAFSKNLPFDCGYRSNAFRVVEAWENYKQIPYVHIYSFSKFPSLDPVPVHEMNKMTDKIFEQRCGKNPPHQFARISSIAAWYDNDTIELILADENPEIKNPDFKEIKESWLQVGYVSAKLKKILPQLKVLIDDIPVDVVLSEPFPTHNRDTQCTIPR